ncbi:MAG: lysine--tRNA ligase [Alphaproteobacteria bacterium]|nr:lysine--tRNA ligase [Alphaproteobacteria bacterium]
MAEHKTVLTDEYFEAALASRAWPFEEARRLVSRINRNPDKYSSARPVLFQTGYGPSGLPHIGTFAEVVRTSMVRFAFRLLTRDAVPTRLVCFSDDMDGLRKVPDNVPDKARMIQYLGQPLSRIPDPFTDEYPSFGAGNNARLRAFLDRFGFDYEFISSTDQYTSGRFDAGLVRMLEVYDQVMEIMLPTLGEERRATYSPFLPVCPRTGAVLQVPVLETRPKDATIVYADPETGEKMVTKVTGGAVKCQWKADWALRWFVLGVDYEMSGKDLIESVRLGGRILKKLGGQPPEGFSYELFLDENGQKISKSRGNGLTMDQWLAYASQESLSLYMFQKPRAAKRLYFDVIPKAVDEYYAFANAYQGQTVAERLGNPLFHIHSGAPAVTETPLSFALLLNLVSAANARKATVLWGFISRYVPDATPQSHPELDLLVGFAIRYFADFVLPKKSFRPASDKERSALEALRDALGKIDEPADATAIQNVVYEVGKNAGFEPLRTWFSALYQVLLGQDQGPRFGSFVALYGVSETRELIDQALAGKLAG